MPRLRVPLETLFAAAAAVWAAALPLAAWVAARAHLSIAAYGASALVYTIGRLVCHQRPERSFHLSGVAMPVCARCLGIYCAAAVAALALAFYPRVDARPGRRPLRAARSVLIASTLPTLATLAVEWATGVTPANWVRALAGMPIGAAVAWIVVSARAPEVN
jgi:uncharacterized membrane protein